ncbi:MAG: prephenate dehydrogenase [Conexibacter sp.]|nr:prephenate dehydrogenase [Conexibacter sp.]
MATAIIGVGNIGKALATNLTTGGEHVVLAANSESSAQAAALGIGGAATAASVPDAIAAADAVIFAVWLDAIKDLVVTHAALLAGKVVIDPSNPVAQNDSGDFVRTLPDGLSAGSVIEGLVPDGAHFVKAFGTLAAPSLASAANTTPRTALFYATDDDVAAAAAERLITAAGFDPVKAGGLDQAIRIEMFGELHEYGGLNGKVLNAQEAQAAVAKTTA